MPRPLMNPLVVQPENASNRVFLGCLNRAIDTCGIKRQALAIDAGYSEFQYSRISSGQSGALDFPDRHPLDVQRAMARFFAEAHGFTVSEPTSVERAARIVAAFDKFTRDVHALTRSL